MSERFDRCSCSMDSLGDVCRFFLCELGDDPAVIANSFVLALNGLKSLASAAQALGDALAQLRFRRVSKTGQQLVIDRDGLRGTISERKRDPLGGHGVGDRDSYLEVVFITEAAHEFIA